jgi:hypothetical protein
MMHGPEESDSVIVAVKPTNKAESSVAEPVEPRTETKGNADQQSTRRAQDRGCYSACKIDPHMRGIGVQN